MRRGMAVDAVIQEILEKLKESYTKCNSSILYQAINSVYENAFRNLVLETSIRCDGRTATDLRPISCEVDTFKPLHGNVLFERGQTQVISL
ncbi:polyribonucleotide nucleotidyltransferase 1, mitochondrial-like isoform X2 [Parasteatoda tepidariorum]|uniref:polyribonucleotide nucleotidyltransferase 1, mitochondrial-like isoform X2 n=1 Tax=Parasteatoda tepidariorum TaxID=114398 RepID=UPI0039BCD123